MATTTKQENNGWLANLAKGQIPTVPMNISFDTSTLISVFAIAIIIVSIILFFKYKK